MASHATNRPRIHSLIGNRRFQVLALFFFVGFPVFAQETAPQFVTYWGAVHPVASLGPDGTRFNFDSRYQVGFPTGINIWKRKSIGYSLEFVPAIRVEKGQARLYYLLFHPGLLWHLNKSFTLAGRLAFETSGRFGFTPVVTRKFSLGQDLAFFISTPLPFRFGAGQQWTFSPGILLGMAF